ncbi:MAG: 6-phosphogluconolactonase [Thermomonas sp.]|nr:MAG: 6-phosphogluconolactonase [Thermomonas sp.]
MGWIEHDHDNSDALIAQVAGLFDALCNDAIDARGRAWLALAGGRTPLPIYARLAASAQAGRILAIPTDERCVPHDHPACNLRALREAFSGSTVSTLALTGEDGAPDLSALTAHPQDFDAVLLGMGADGHFASLFPGAANLADGLALDSGIDAIATLPDPLPPEAPFARISLSLPRLLRAREIHLVVTGEAKRRVLRQAQQQDAGSGLPIAALLHARTRSVQIHWSP